MWVFDVMGGKNNGVWVHGLCVWIPFLELKFCSPSRRCENLGFVCFSLPLFDIFLGFVGFFVFLFFFFPFPSHSKFNSTIFGKRDKVKKSLFLIRRFQMNICFFTTTYSDKWLEKKLLESLAKINH